MRFFELFVVNHFLIPTSIFSFPSVTLSILYCCSLGIYPLILQALKAVLQSPNSRPTAAPEPKYFKTSSTVIHISAYHGLKFLFGKAKSVCLSFPINKTRLPIEIPFTDLITNKIDLFLSKFWSFIHRYPTYPCASSALISFLRVAFSTNMFKDSKTSGSK